MATQTPNLILDKPTVGADADQWGTLLNQSLDTLDLAVQFGALTKSVAGGVNVTLTANEAAKQIIILTGAITANIAVIVPNSPARRYLVRNNTTGAFTVTIRRAVGTGVVVPQGSSRIVYNDGAEVFFEDVQNALNATNATNATTATNVSGGTASVTTLTASGAAALNGGTTTTTFSATANVSLGDAGSDTTTVNSQVSANGTVGTAGQVLASRGTNLSPRWQDSITPTIGSAPYYGVRAFVNFDGTGTVGASQTIRSQGNVSNVVKNATGDYTITFSTALADANYAVVTGGIAPAGGANGGVFVYGASGNYITAQLKTASQLRIYTGGQSSTDLGEISVAILR